MGGGVSAGSLDQSGSADATAASTWEAQSPPNIGRALGTLRALDLTWVCCGVDYPHLVEGDADYALYWRPKPWDHAPGSLLLSEVGGHVGTFDGSPYRPQLDELLGLVSAADRATYDLVQGLVSALPPR